MHTIFKASIKASVLVAALAIAGSASARDGNFTPVGTWKTIDDASGKVYKSKAELTEGGNKLQVRGYVGVPMFGRSQTWVREE